MMNFLLMNQEKTLRVSIYPNHSLITTLVLLLNPHEMFFHIYKLKFLVVHVRVMTTMLVDCGVKGEEKDEDGPQEATQ